ncbi:vitamin K epoxide reductase family protein [Candidatus Saccharibacteria bacterium]|nr:vitamin K epoxide reductase family protein [Candidatus Saccharibacteria bacterium]
MSTSAKQRPQTGKSVRNPTKHTSSESSNQARFTSVNSSSGVKRSPSPQSHPTQLSWLDRYISYVLILCGAIGLSASIALAIEEFQYLKNPTGKLICDLNPVVGCGSILDSWQGHALFGVPNQIWGIAMFASLLTVGVSILAGATYRRWFWQMLQIGLFAGVGFVIWFMFQSLFVLKHLCPFCMTTWLVTLVGFWYLLLYSIRAEHIRLHGALARLNHFAQKHHADIIVFVLLAVVGAIMWRFWYYWKTLL